MSGLCTCCLHSWTNNLKTSVANVAKCIVMRFIELKTIQPLVLRGVIQNILFTSEALGAKNIQLICQPLEGYTTLRFAMPWDSGFRR